MSNSNHVNSILGNWLPFFKFYIIVVCVDYGGENDWMETSRCESCGLKTYALDLPDMYSDSLECDCDTFINIYSWIESWKCLQFSWPEWFQMDRNICFNKRKFPFVPRHNNVFCILWTESFKHILPLVFGMRLYIYFELMYSSHSLCFRIQDVTCTREIMIHPIIIIFIGEWRTWIFTTAWVEFWHFGFDWKWLISLVYRYQDFPIIVFNCLLRHWHVSRPNYICSLLTSSSSCSIFPQHCILSRSASTSPLPPVGIKNKNKYTRCSLLWDFSLPCGS